MQEERFVSGNAEQSYSGFKIKKKHKSSTTEHPDCCKTWIWVETNRSNTSVVKIAVLIVICIESNLAELEWDTGVLSWWERGATEGWWRYVW